MTIFSINTCCSFCRARAQVSNIMLLPFPLFLSPMTIQRLLFAASTLLFMACSSDKTGEHQKPLPKPGTTIAEAQMPIEDALNHFIFSVKVVADSEIANGVYDVDADFGPNFGEG